MIWPGCYLPLCQAVTAFGQTWFGHPYLAAFGQTEFGQTAFGQFCLWWGHGGVGAGARKSGARRVGGRARRVGPEGWGPEGWGPKGGEPKILRFFCSLPPEIHSFFSLWGFSRGILVVFETPGRSNVRVWSSLVVVFGPQTTTTNRHHQQAPTGTNRHQQAVKYKFIKTTFIKKKMFIKIHIHQKPLSSKTKFIRNHFHQKPFSSETIFIRKNETKGWDSQYSPCLCEGVAGRRPATPSHKHGLCPPFGFQHTFMWSIAGRRPAMLIMKVCWRGLGFRSLGFRV